MFTALAGFMQEGGFFMFPITAALGLGIAVVVERGNTLIRKFNVDGPKFFAEIRRLVERGDMSGAAQLCNEAPLPRILRAGIEAAAKGERAIQNAIDEAGLEVLPLVERRTHYLSLIANVSTLLGLLGTVQGLIQAFAAVAGADPSQKAALLAQGIAMAMNTTAYGLVVAIPCMVAYAILQSKTTKIVNEIDEYSVKLINLLAARASRG